MNTLFKGKLTRLVAADPDTVGEYYAKWSNDSEFMQRGFTRPRLKREKDAVMVLQRTKRRNAPTISVS